ncbi:MAG: sulfite exporter TauE/SafE family protein [Polyangiaceae bacterium]|nr:sulfite exporter TauE/SafE family protein [Polyangiaceae bacterium]
MPVPSTSQLLLAGVVMLAFTVESAIGFGAMLVTVSLGSALLRLDVLLAAVVPLNVGLSAYLTARYAREVDRPLFTRRVVPAMLLGLPVGLLALSRLDPRWLKGALGAFVVVVAVAELTKRRDDGARTPRLARPTAWGLLALAGVFHGAFSTGGPLAVYVLSREGLDKAAFRATLSALWLVLGVVLVATYAATGAVGRDSLVVSFALALPAALGTALGELAHRRVSQRAFSRVVFALLVVVGVVLLAKSAAG